MYHSQKVIVFSGYINRAELSRYLTMLGDKLSAQECQKIMDAMDAKNVGKGRKDRHNTVSVRNLIMFVTGQLEESKDKL